MIDLGGVVGLSCSPVEVIIDTGRDAIDQMAEHGIGTGQHGSHFRIGQAVVDEAALLPRQDQAALL